MADLGILAMTGDQVFLPQQEFWAACCHSHRTCYPLRSHLPVFPAFLFAVAARLLAVLHCPRGVPVSYQLLFLFPLCEALTPDGYVVSSLPSLESEFTHSSHQGVSTAPVAKAISAHSCCQSPLLTFPTDWITT